MAAPHTIGVFATIRDDARHVLLCRRRDGDFWCQPGGGVEAGETPWAGLVREVREETGLEVTVERLVGVYSWPRASDVILSFICRVVGGALTTSDEARAVAYFSPDARPPNIFAEHAERIRDALAPTSTAIFRVPRAPSAADELHAGR
jgi:ADP-ribose pyrophosphatase YjhB (NUDIX family)